MRVRARYSQAERSTAERCAGGRGKISARKLAANRANARRSTGPRTAAGKARSARNARRHGLTLPVFHDPTLSSEVEALARAIAGPQADAEHFAAAFRIAEAQIDLVRVRRARWQLMAELQRHTEQELFSVDEKAQALIGRLAALDRYERGARARRKRAIRAFDAIGLPPRAVRDTFRTKPMSQRALLRLAGWKNPLADYLRGYPGLLRAAAGWGSDRTRHRDLAKSKPTDESARTATPAASPTGRPDRSQARSVPVGVRVHRDAAGSGSGRARHRDSAQTNPAGERTRPATPAPAGRSNSGHAQRTPGGVRVHREGASPANGRSGHRRLRKRSQRAKAPAARRRWHAALLRGRGPVHVHARGCSGWPLSARSRSPPRSASAGTPPFEIHQFRKNKASR